MSWKTPTEPSRPYAVWAKRGTAILFWPVFGSCYEQAVLDYRSPLKNFAEIIQLGALEADACRELASKPMQTMRLEYADAALIEQLLAATGQRANLMAIACHEILAQLRPDAAGDYQRRMCTGHCTR